MNKKLLLEIDETLSKFPESKSQLLAKHVQERLDKAFQSYCEELDDSIEFLSRRNGMRIARKIAKGG